jgi:hypothetical protein
MPSPGAKRTRRSFPVYDNMSYIGKPDTTKYGLIRSNIIDDAHIWSHGQNYGVLPSRGVFDALVAANKANPGPIVLVSRIRDSFKKSRHVWPEYLSNIARSSGGWHRLSWSR